MVSDQNEREQRTEQRITVRQVTHVQASWTEETRGSPGAFTIQLLLDQGSEEYVLRPAAEDMEPLLRLFELSHGATFDLERKILIFSGLALGA